MRRLIYILLFLAFLFQSYAVDFHGETHIYKNAKSKVRTYYGADSLLGLEDVKGTKLTPAIYTEMGEETRDGMIMVEVDDSLYGLIDFKGKTLLPPVYSFIDRELFWGHLTVEKDGKRWGLMYNRKTESFDEVPIREDAQKSPILYSLKKQYEQVEIVRNHANMEPAAGGFSEFGYANVIDAFNSEGWGIGPCKDTLAYQVKKENKYYIISIDGQKIITEGQVFHGDRNYTDSIHFVYNEDTLVVVDFRKQEVIDKITFDSNQKGKSTYVTVTNMKGEKYTFESPEYSQVKNVRGSDGVLFHDKFYWEYIIGEHKRTKKKGVIKLCLSSDKSTPSGVVAKIIVPVKYEEVERLGDAQFYFYDVYTESCAGLYTMDGDPVIPCGSKYNFFRIERIKNYDGYEIKGDVGSVYDDYKVGVFSLEGKRMIIPCEYKKIDLVEMDGANYFKAKSDDNQYVYFTLTGEKVSHLKEDK
ncbi:MAG: hypothetical protein VZQ98_03945 [Bacteroidales bacterium]|nr:hypothetical protein [Bacteroidales bacterium]